MSVRIITGDCREVLATLPDESVHCCITSPPYWGLRDYGTGTWEGGDAGCDHLGAPFRTKSKLNENWGAGFSDVKNSEGREPMGANCSKCGARRIDRQIGLESNITDYIATIVKVFHEVRRVLRKDGTLWLNMGDSYASSINGRKAEDIVNDDRTFRDKPFSTITADWKSRVGQTGNRGNSGADHGFRIFDPTLKPKDLCGIPWRVAFALQADGWWLRQDIIWSKPNPMPESVRDRCTKSHEYLFLLSKSERYFYDAEAIREPHDDPERWLSEEPGENYGGTRAPERAKAKLLTRSWRKSQEAGNPNGRNRRSVWEIATEAFQEIHFATFPTKLVEPCILAGCPAKCCARCGAPWVREVEVEQVKLTGSTGNAHKPGANNWESVSSRTRKDITTLGFSPSCTCNAGTKPGTILDPFAGAGTAGLVADRLQRDAVLIELSKTYVEMARRRIRDDAGMFAALENPTSSEWDDMWARPFYPREE